MALTLNDRIKQLALDELRSKGYSPNPADVHGIVAGFLAILEDEVANEVSKVEAKVKAELIAKGASPITPVTPVTPATVPSTNPPTT